MSASAGGGDDLVGTVVGERYRVLSCLSRGGMGVVYRAQHTVLNKPLALKIMLPGSDEAAQQRFLQEAKLASMVRHPNIVDIGDFGRLPTGEPFIIMELLVGETLADAIAKGPIVPSRACFIAAQVARGLNACHQEGILHRDLKPANIFLVEQDGPEGRVEVAKVVDFGIALVVPKDNGESRDHTPTPARLTVPGMVMGTAEYMAPEQAQGFKTDHRIDQYALGCILYEMLTGRVPFQGASPAATMLKHLTDRAAPPSSVRPEMGISSALERIVERAMAMKPENRFPSMRELESELNTLYEQSRIRATNPSQSQPATARVPSVSVPTTPRRRAYVAGGVIGLFVGAVLLIGLMARKPAAQSGKTTLTTTPTETKPARMVSWQVTSNPSGARIVRISDGRELGKTPWTEEHPLVEGMTAVELRLDGYQAQRLVLDRQSNERQHTELRSISTAPTHVRPPPSKGKTGKKRGIRDNNEIEAFK